MIIRVFVFIDNENPYRRTRALIIFPLPFFSFLSSPLHSLTLPHLDLFERHTKSIYDMALFPREL